MKNNPPVKNQRFLPAPFTQGGLYAAGGSYLRVDALREEQRAMPAHEEPPVLPGGSFLHKENHALDAWFRIAYGDEQKEN